MNIEYYKLISIRPFHSYYSLSYKLYQLRTVPNVDIFLYIVSDFIYVTL